MKRLREWLRRRRIRRELRRLDARTLEQAKVLLETPLGSPAAHVVSAEIEVIMARLRQLFNESEDDFWDTWPTR